MTAKFYNHIIKWSLVIGFLFTLFSCFVYKQIKLKERQHVRTVIIEKNVIEKRLVNSKVDFSFKFITTDSIFENPFTGEKINSEIITDILIYNKGVLFQSILNINEFLLSCSEKENIGCVKLEDIDNDNDNDLWILFAPYTRMYDSDYIIFNYDAENRKFSKERGYLLKNLTAKELKDKFGLNYNID